MRCLDGGKDAMPGARLARASLAGSLLFILALFAPVHASGQMTRRVRTQDGLSFALPTKFRPVQADSAAVRAMGPGEQLEASYRDDAAAAIQLYVLRNAAGTRSSLPLPSEAVAQEFTAGFIAGVRRRAVAAQPRVVTPAVYHPRRGAYALQYQVERHVAEAAGLFDAEPLTVEALAFVTRPAYIHVSIVAPSARAADAQALSRLILQSAQVPPKIKLEPSLLHELEPPISPRTAGRLVGALLGPLLVVVVIGGLLALWLGKLGVRASLAVPGVCAVVLLVIAVGAMRAPVFSIFTLIQCCAYPVTIACVLRPLTRWVAARVPSAAS